MNRTIKKLICLGTAFIYILVSQFIAKARLTTDRDLTSSDSYCTNKKLDTYESKRGCWKKHMTADFSDTLSEVTESKKILTQSYPFFVNYTFSTIFLAKVRTHWPPPDTLVSFVDEYVGVTVLML